MTKTMLKREFTIEDIDILSIDFNSKKLLLINSNGKKLSLVLSEQNGQLILDSLDKWLDLFHSYKLDCLLLLPSEKAPLEKQRIDDPIQDMIFDASFYDVRPLFEVSDMAELCYSIADQLSINPQVQAFMVRTLDNYEVQTNSVKKSKLSLAIPHQGDLAYLERCLQYVQVNTLPVDSANVYIDEQIELKHFHLAKRSKNCNFQNIVPPNQGPYVSRNHALITANTPYVCFQDSDDIPTIERFQHMDAAVDSDPSIDILGCHEIRIDDYERMIKVIRFPINGSKALDNSPMHVLLHPTSVMKTIIVNKAGLFSTNRRFAADTQFLLRAHFSSKIENLDKFLYIRHRHEGSLTTSDETKLGTPIRKHLHAIWKQAFFDVKNKIVSIEESDLAEEHTKVEYSIQGLDLNHK